MMENMMNMHTVLMLWLNRRNLRFPHTPSLLEKKRFCSYNFYYFYFYKKNTIYNYFFPFTSIIFLFKYYLITKHQHGLHRKHALYSKHPIHNLPGETQPAKYIEMDTIKPIR